MNPEAPTAEWIEPELDCHGKLCGGGAVSPNDSICEDGNICTTFVCDPLSGCLDAGPPPEYEATCQDVPAVPSLPPWALVVTTGIMVAGGSVGLWRARKRRTGRDTEG